MSKNTGKPSEKAFEDIIKSYGKRATCFRLVDASEITGRTGKIAVSARAQPSDYVLVMGGKVSLAEVKSTGNATSFAFSLIKSPQWVAATLTTAAGGSYDVYVHSLNTQQWYKIPFVIIQQTIADGKASLKWSELEEYTWPTNITT